MTEDDRLSDLLDKAINAAPVMVAIATLFMSVTAGYVAAVVWMSSNAASESDLARMALFVIYATAAVIIGLLAWGVSMGFWAVVQEAKSLLARSTDFTNAHQGYSQMVSGVWKLKLNGALTIGGWLLIVVAAFLLPSFL